MWFASIWIFTLGYNWKSGAEFFKRNLLDFCPASNTLGWRWVAGLQTINKPYLAVADNINYFTNGRFNPTGQLNEKVDLNYNEQNSSHVLPFIEPEKFDFKKNNLICLILTSKSL